MATLVSYWKNLGYACVAAALLAATDVSSFTQPPRHSRSSPATPCQRRRHSHQAARGFGKSADVNREDRLDLGEMQTLPPSPFVIALTREEGKNVKLQEALQSMSNERILKHVTSDSPVITLELPCIEHADGPDAKALSPTLSSNTFDYVAVTSPEAARVLASAWETAGRPTLGKVAAVGKATGEALEGLGIDVAFVPGKATAATLVKELPKSSAAAIEGRPTSVLYPASAKAQDTLQNGLEERGFAVTRLNTYDTVPASLDEDKRGMAQSATVVCFASPSAVKAWLKNTEPSESPRALACCIGETSASACRKEGWGEESIFYPDKPGVDGWVDAIADALEYISEQ